MNSPTISVLMPVYNAERYIAEATESILAQTFNDFEFLIVDDGSTDGSLAILQKYAAMDSRISLFSRQNQGIFRTRNEALRLARGEFIAIMDSDDICLPQRLEIQLNYLRNDSRCVAVGCRVELIDPDGDLIGRWDLPLDHRAIDDANLIGYQSIVHPSLFARRELVLTAGGYRQDLSEDLDLMLRLAEIGRLANVPDILLRYRRHSGSVTHSFPGPLLKGSFRSISDAWLRRGLGEPPSLPAADRTVPSVSFDHQNWAWMALGIGNVATARKHARRALRLKPFSFSSWRVAYCAVRGY